MSPELAGGFLITGPPGKSQGLFFLVFVSTEIFPKASGPPETLWGMVLLDLTHCLRKGEADGVQ